MSSRTDDHRPEGDAPHEDGPETGSDPGVIRWCTRPSTNLPRTAHAFNKVARLRQAAQMWQPDFEKCFEEMMESLTGEELDALLPTEVLHLLGHASMASDSVWGDTFAVPLTWLPRLAVPRAVRWTWSSKPRKWLMSRT